MRTTSARRADAAMVRRAATSFAARARAERAGHLTINQVAVLGRIATEGPITPRELADQLRMLPQSLTRPLASLEAGGLARRTADPTDGRAALLEITSDGVQALRDEMAPRNRWVAETIAAVCTDEEFDVLVRAAEIMERLVEAGGRVAVVEP